GTYRLARHDSVCPCTGAGRVGDLYHDPGRLERADQPANHDHRGDWPLPLHAKPHLSWYGTWAHRLGPFLSQVLAVVDGRGLRTCDPLRCDHSRGSLSRAQVRGRLSPLPHAGTALAVGLVGPRPALALFHEQPRELRLLAGRIWEGNYFPRIGRCECGGSLSCFRTAESSCHASPHATNRSLI